MHEQSRSSQGKITIMVNNTDPNNSPSEQWYFLGVIVTLLVACIVCNGIIVAVFIAEKLIRNHANMFVVSLACADLVVGMISMPLWIANSSHSLHLHYYSISVDILCFSASIFNCALLSIERALKISFPYWYTNNVTAYKLKVVILVGWIAAVLVGSLSLLRGTDKKNPPYIIFISIFVYILPVLAIFTSYTSIFFVAHKHVKSIREQESRIDGETTCMRMSEVKTARRLSVFITVFIICWTPFFVKTWLPLFLQNKPPLPFMVVANTLPNINAVINPFLYALFNPSFRRGMITFYKKKKTRKKMESSRKNEISTGLTNLNNSPSLSRAVSTQFFSQTDRRELHSANLRKEHKDSFKKLITTSDTEKRQTNKEEKFIPKNNETTL